MKVRESNIELLRLIAMLLIFLVHANYFSLGGVELVDIQQNRCGSFIKALAEQLCIIGPNVFILISGWFGIRPSIKGGCSILFQVFFYHILLVLISILLGDTPSTDIILGGFYFGRPYWFIIAYLILYILSPVLNIYIENASVRSYLSTLVFFFISEFVYGWITNVGSFASGYSAMSFVGLYLLAGFVRKYSKSLLRVGVHMNIILYMFWTVLPVVIFFISKHKCNMMAYSSPFVILASLHFFLAFNRMKFTSSIINYLGCSSLSIYLIHQHPLVVNHFVRLMNYAYYTLGGYGYIVFVLLFGICFGILCILLDKVRILFWGSFCKFFFDKAITKFVKFINNLYMQIGY